MPARRQELSISELTPAASAGALGHENPIRRAAGPMMQAIGEACGVIGQRRLRTQIDGAVALALDRYGGIIEGNRAQWMLARPFCRRAARSCRVCCSCLGAHVTMVSPSRSCARGMHVFAPWLPCRFARRLPSAIP